MLLFSLLFQQLHAQGGTNPTVPNCIILADPVEICVGQSVSFFKFNASGSEDCDTIPTATSDVISAEFHPGAGIPPITIPGNPTTGFYFQNVSITYNVPGVYYPYIIFYNAPPYQPTTIYPVEMQNNGPGSNYIPAVITVSDVPVISSPSSGLSFCDNGLNEVVLMNNPIPALYPNAIELSFQYALPTDNVTVDWGDGNQGNFTVASFNAGIAQVTHYYPGTGLYIIQITVDGQCGTSTFQIPVYIMKLSAMFSFAAGCQGYPVQFDYSNFCFDPQQHLLTWHYGDGNSLTNTTNTAPQHAYTGTGPYVVTLTVSDLAGNPLAQWSQSVSLLPAVSPQFTPSSLIECEQAPYMLVWLNYNAYVNGVVTSITDPFGQPVNYVQNGGQVEILDPIVQGAYTIAINDNNDCPGMIEINVLPCCDADNYTLPNHSTLYGMNIPQFQGGTVTPEFQEMNITVTDLMNQHNFGSNFFLDRTFVINGTLWIDQDAKFRECIILMGPNARIELVNAATLEFDKECRLLPCDSYMWDGVYADSPDEKVVISASQFYGAKNAIHLSNFAVLDCNSGFFEQNHTGIFVSDYVPSVLNPNPTTNVEVVNSYFNYLPNQNLLFPYSYLTRPFAGVHAIRVRALSIGVQSGGNQFKNSTFGILAENSEIISYHNEFANHGGPWNNTNQYRPAGITAFGTVPSYWWVGLIQPKVTLAAGTENKFYNSEHGVYGFNIQADLQDAYFEGNEKGIHIKDIRGTGIVDRNEGLNNTQHILLERVFPNSPNQMNLKVRSNHLTGGQGGILLTNLASGSTNNVQVINDTIIFNQYLGPMAGIVVENCQGILVRGNRVTNTQVTPVGFASTHSGIRIVSTAQAHITENVITRMSGGITCGGNLPQSQYTCNDFDNCFNGFYFIDQVGNFPTTLSDQRSNGKASDNRWLNHGTGFRMDGYLTLLNNNQPYKWYFRGDGGANAQQYNPRIHPIYINQWLYDAFDELPNTNNLTECAPIVRSESELRDELLNEARNYDSDSTENKYWEMEYAYREQMEYGDPSNPDSVYMAMEAMMDSTNIPAFVHATRLMEEGLFPEAIQALEEITPHHSWEDVRKATLLIYAREYAWGRLEGDSQYELELLNALSPFYYGEGIFSSRVMMDYIALFDGVTYKGEIEQAIEAPELIVYPNPTKNYLKIDFQEKVEGKVTLRWMDILGRTISLESYDVNGLTLELTELSFPSGIYLLEVAFRDTIRVIKVVIE